MGDDRLGAKGLKKTFMAREQPLARAVSSSCRRKDGSEGDNEREFRKSKTGSKSDSLREEGGLAIVAEGERIAPEQQAQVDAKRALGTLCLGLGYGSRGQP